MTERSEKVRAPFVGDGDLAVFLLNGEPLTRFYGNGSAAFALEKSEKLHCAGCAGSQLFGEGVKLDIHDLLLNLY